MDDWRQIFRQIAYQRFGQYPDLYLCDDGDFGDYYSNIALRCDKKKAWSSAKQLQQDLMNIDEWVEIQVSSGGFLNFKLKTKAKLEVLENWQVPRDGMKVLTENIPHSTWHAWRLFHTQKCLENFGISTHSVTCGQCRVMQNAAFCDVLNIQDADAMLNFWLSVTEYKIHQDVQLEWIQPLHSVIVVYNRLQALFQQWDVSLVNIGKEDILSTPQERKFLSLIGQFDDFKNEVLKTKQLDIWSKYLKSIAREMQSYYNVVVFNDDNLLACSARYKMLKAIFNVLHNGLAYLGWNPIRE